MPHPCHWLKERLSKKTIDFSFLPKLPEPRVLTSSCVPCELEAGCHPSSSQSCQVPMKFGPNHFLYESSMNKQRSMSPSSGWVGRRIRMCMP